VNAELWTADCSGYINTVQLPDGRGVPEALILRPEGSGPCACYLRADIPTADFIAYRFLQNVETITVKGAPA
jgi:hypothetical protein